jgi:hypothetical protein
MVYIMNGLVCDDRSRDCQAVRGGGSIAVEDRKNSPGKEVISVLPWIGIALVFWAAIWLSSDHIYDKVMGLIERWRREHRRTH